MDRKKSCSGRWSFALLALAFLITLAGAARATDVSTVSEDDKFAPQRITLMSGMSVETNEVRRAAKMTEEPRASIAVWCPWMEPPPVERNRADMIDGTKCKIYKNIGATRDRYPFVVRAVTPENDGPFYVYRNVRYNWKFETSPADEALGGNRPGKSGRDPWTPFYRQALLESEVLSFIQQYAKDKVGPDSLPEKKAFANRHTTVYDSGITGNTQVAESTILQQVGMTLTYDRADVTAEVTAVPVVGTGYPDGDSATADLADPGDTIQSTVTLDAAIDEQKWVKDQKVINPVPSAFSSVWTLGECSAYSLCYVEDYRKPAGSGLASRGNTYEGSVGGYIKGGVVIDYEDDNTEAKAESDQLQAKLKYYVGNGDVYKVQNPFYGEDSTHETRSLPYLTFFYLAANSEFGPYACASQRDRELDWYVDGHPYWSSKEQKEIIEYVGERYGNAWNSNGIPDWELGVVFTTLGLDGKGKNSKRITEQLNDAWTRRSMENCTYFQALRADLLSRKSNGGTARALAALNALENVILKGAPGMRDDRTFYRFAAAGYDPNLGSYCIGPQKLEKDNPLVHQEWAAEKKGVPIKKGKWILAEKRLILPKHFTQAAFDSTSTDLFTSKQILQVVLADCCGNMTTVNPSTENSRDGVIIHDDAESSLPVPEMFVQDPISQTDIPIQVPSNADLAEGEKLVIKSKKEGTEKEYGPSDSVGQFDLANNDFFLQHKDGTRSQISPLGGDSKATSGGEKSIFEDTRVQFTLGGYDNVDGMSSFRGVGKQKLEIFSIDEAGTRIAPEQLEFVDDAGQAKTAEFVERSNTGDPYKFKPQYRIHHIFRKPGRYQVAYTMWEYTNPSGPKQSRTMTYNVRVQDSKTENRSIQSETINH